MSDPEERPDWHPEPTNWKAIAIILIGVLLMVAVVVVIVSLMGTFSPAPAAPISSHTPNVCAQCH